MIEWWLNLVWNGPGMILALLMQFWVPLFVLAVIGMIAWTIGEAVIRRRVH